MEGIQLRRTAYTLMMLVTIAAATARVVGVELVYEPSLYRNESDPQAYTPRGAWPKTRPAPTPMFSSNDRSRWATVRALVDEGSFAIGKREITGDKSYSDSGIIFEDGWTSVDKILDPVTHKFYSSKPPLLPVLVAGEYWVLQRMTGWTLKDDTRKVVATLVLTINVIPLAIYLYLLSRLIERFGTTSWGRLFAFATACFGTFISTFVTTFNNHTVAAVTTLMTVYPLLMSEELSIRSLLICGLFAGLTACFELPAMSLVAGLAVGLLFVVPRNVPAFILAALVPIGALAALNYAAIGDWKPAYEKLDSEWYRYEGSHWKRLDDDKKGIDAAKYHESRETYAFHLLVGHHGVFSLSPVWMLSLAGMIGSAIRSGLGNRWRQVMLLTFGITVIVTVYFAWLVGTANYGGWTAGPRWFFWLTPLWILALLPASDWLAPRWFGRMIGYGLLFASVFSVAFPVANPWRHPWILQLLNYLGYSRY